MSLKKLNKAILRVKIMENTFKKTNANVYLKVY